MSDECNGTFKFHGDHGVHRGVKRSDHTANRENNRVLVVVKFKVVLQFTVFTGRFERTITP